MALMRAQAVLWTALCLGPGFALAQEVTPPTATCPDAPKYPEGADTGRRTGSVSLQLFITPEGTLERTEVVQGMGSPFDEAARASVATCTFTAAKSGDVNAPSRIDMQVAFVPPPLPATLSGEVVGELGEAVVGALVASPKGSASTDEAGHFTLVLQVEGDDEVPLTASHLDYAAKSTLVLARPDRETSVRFVLPRRTVHETRVEAHRLLADAPQLDSTPRVSHFEVTARDIDRTPGSLEDIVRVVQSLPGVVGDSDLLATLAVRGGSPNETVVFLDGVPLSNPFHLGGFASIFNPLLIDKVDFFAGAQPARYPTSLSGVIDVRYPTAPAKDLKVVGDISINTAKARVDVPLPLEGASFTLAARRSYYEAYFAILKALKVVGANYVSPEITELYAKAQYATGKHSAWLSAMHVHDGFSFVAKPGEQVLINFAGGLSISNSLQLISGGYRYQLPGDGEFSVVGAFHLEDNKTNINGDSVYRRDLGLVEGMLRADLTYAFSPHHALSAGFLGQLRRFSFSGDATDNRDVAPLSDRPFVETYAPVVSIAPVGVRPLLQFYVDDTVRPTEALTLRAGARIEVDVARPLVSGLVSASGSYLFPTATVLKVAVAGITKTPENPFYIDPVFGNPRLLDERSLQVIAGVEQALPIDALVRLEGYWKGLDRLVVNPDTRAGLDARLAAGQPAYSNDGTGQAYGGDVIFMGRAGPVQYGIAAALIFSNRQNPLAQGLTSYPSSWDQRFTLSANASWQIAKTWLVGARVSTHTGRPYTPVVGFTENAAQGRYEPVFGPTNSARYPATVEVTVRGEKHFRTGPLAWSVYVEVLNVTNTTNVFSYTYDRGDFAAGQVPAQSQFNHLPIRPFLGVRAEY